MATTREELDQFHRFALERLARGDEALELDELILFWYDDQERQEINDVIRQGLSDIEAGLGRPAREVSDVIRIKFGIPSE